MLRSAAGGTIRVQARLNHDRAMRLCCRANRASRPALIARACPIVGSYPERDFTARQARRLDPALTRFGVRHDIKIYPGARHSFFNETRPAYDATAAADAWARTLAFLRETLV